MRGCVEQADYLFIFFTVEQPPSNSEFIGEFFCVVHFVQQQFITAANHPNIEEKDYLSLMSSV